MSLKIKATSYGGLPVVGKGGSRISFNSSKVRHNPSKKATKATARLTGGSFEVGNKKWTSLQGQLEAAVILDTIDLEALTEMKAE
ncbi:MAG: hypothetical protein Q9172_007496 [Xanthocarpia lactea]